MKLINKIKILGIGLSASMLIFSSCNKVETTPTPLVIPGTPTGLALSDALAATPSDSMFYRLLLRSGLRDSVNIRGRRYTMFVADNNAMKVFINGASGGAIPLGAPDANFYAFINSSLPATTAAQIVSYNVLPQVITSSNFATGGSAATLNLPYATTFNPAPALSALLRLDVFLSKRSNGAWVNNIPVVQPDIYAANGVYHQVAALNTPPSQYLWDRINTDPALTYFKAAIQRADSGVAAANTLQAALQNIGANFTVFAPTDAAFQALLTGQITAYLVSIGVPPATAATTAATLASSPTIFTNPLVANVLTPTVVKGIVVYHMFDDRNATLASSITRQRPGRVFSVNFPTSSTAYPSLLSSADTVGITYPSVNLAATFTSVQVSAASVKGAANATASNLLINPTPAPNGTSDQNYLNGVLHKIDQVLRPQ